MFENQKESGAKGTRDCALYRKNFFFGIGDDDRSMLQGDALKTHVARKSLPFQDFPRFCTHTDRTRFTVVMRSVGIGTRTKVVSLDDARKALAFGRPKDRDQTLFRNALDRELGSHLDTLQGIHKKFFFRLIPNMLPPFPGFPFLPPDSDNNGIIPIPLLLPKADHRICRNM